MSLLYRLAATLVLGLVLSGVAAAAGSVASFEAALRAAYGDYRAALFQTNSGNKDGAVDRLLWHQGGRYRYCRREP